MTHSWERGKGGVGWVERHVGSGEEGEFSRHHRESDIRQRNIFQTYCGQESDTLQNRSEETLIGGEGWGWEGVP